MASILDLFDRVKGNLSLLKKKGYYSNIDPLLNKEKHQELIFREATPQEKKRFLFKLKQNTKKERANDRIWFLMALFLFVIGFIWIMQYVI